VEKEKEEEEEVEKEGGFALEITQQQQLEARLFLTE
jgi:hypothetical protein